MRYLFYILSFSVIALAVSTTSAQKLPNKQETGIWATIKADGKSNDWPAQYAAFNKSTEVFYSIANDNDNLYVIVHAEKSRIIEKMIEGGTSFTVVSSKKSSCNITVLFPLLTLPSGWEILHSAGKPLTEVPAPRACPPTPQWLRCPTHMV